MKKEVHIISAKQFLFLSESEFDKFFNCFDGRKEYIVFCPKDLKQKLEKLTSDDLIPELSKVKDYLEKQGIDYYIN